MTATAGLPIPALLRSARAVFGTEIRRDLAHAGYDDLPPNGPYVLAALAGTGAPLGHVIQRLGVSKQAGGQLVDSLVVRGYLDRQVDPGDRRRLTVTPTERGGGAAAVIAATVAGVEANLVERVGERAVRTFREVLAALVDESRPEVRPEVGPEVRTDG